MIHSFKYYGVMFFLAVLAKNTGRQGGKTGAIVDCKTVVFFLKISKEIGKAWRKSLTRAKRATFTCFQPHLTVRAYLNTQKYVRTVLHSRTIDSARDERNEDSAQVIENR